MKENRRRNSLILVTGATGFLGSRVVQRLALGGLEVVALGRGSEGNFDAGEPGPVQYLGTDLLRGPMDWKSGVLENIGTIVHLAAVPGSDSAAFRAHVTLGLHVLTNAPASLRGMILASSAYVYPPSPGCRINEAFPVAPRDGYGWAKLFLETLFQTESARRNIPMVALRLCSLYGPGEPHNKMITKFVSAVRAGERPRVAGESHLRRDYLHVDDGARAVANAVQKILNGRGGIYNIGSGIGTSADHVADLLCNMSGVGARDNIDRIEEVDHYVFDHRRAASELDFRPEISMEDGLRSCLAANAAYDTPCHE